MMKKIFILILLIAITMLTSCTKTKVNENLGTTQDFSWGELSLSVTNVKEIKSRIASDGYEEWEEKTFVVYEGARAIIKNADMFTADDGTKHGDWAFFKGTPEDYEKIYITDDMGEYEITPDVKFVYDPESGIGVLIFEMAGEE